MKSKVKNLFYKILIGLSSFLITISVFLNTIEIKKNIIKMKPKGKKLFFKILIGLASCLFTVFVFLNTYEVVFNKDIAVANSVRKMASTNVIDRVIQEYAIKTDIRTLDSNSPMGELDYFEIPSIGTRVSLEEGRKINSNWYGRPSMAHYIGLNKDDYGNTVDYLIYTSKSWRTISYTDQIENDTEIKFYNRQGLSFMFQVKAKTINPIHKSFIVDKAETRQILLLVEDSKNNQYYGYSLVAEQ